MELVEDKESIVPAPLLGQERAPILVRVPIEVASPGLRQNTIGQCGLAALPGSTGKNHFPFEIFLSRWVH